MSFIKTSLHQTCNIPLRTTEHEAALVRRCLRKFARQLQRQGAISSWVSEAELNFSVDDQVYPLLRLLHHNPVYNHVQGKGQKAAENFLYEILQQASRSF